MNGLSLGGGEPGATALAPVQLRNLGEQVADRLVTAIALGEYITGQRLPTERELAALLAVNRASVREALHRLSAAGYVEIRRGRHGGAYVVASWGPDSRASVQRTLATDWDAFEELFDLRALIEPVIAATAAERHDAASGEAIRAANAAYLAADDDREASRAADQALHLAIASATGNRHLVELSQEIRARVSLGFQAEPYSVAIRAIAKVQHDRLVEAILERRADDAGAIAREHFSLTETALREVLVRAGEEPA
jgi:GntR family transcriptional regulator, transcriptional repressor for pyruvate dehydrogenase complex